MVLLCINWQMLEFYYDLLYKYFSRQDFELCHMDTDSFCLAMSNESLDDIVRPEMKQAYETDKKNWLATDKFSERSPGLFKPEFIGTRGVWLTAKCHLVQNETLNENKYSCKGVSQKHNDLHFQRYKNVLDVSLKTKRDSELEEKDIDKTKNVGFRAYDQGMVTYEQTSSDYLPVTISVIIRVPKVPFRFFDKLKYEIWNIVLIFVSILKFKQKTSK